MQTGTRVTLIKAFGSRGEGVVLPSTFSMHRYVTVLWDDGRSSCELVAHLDRVG